MPANKVDNISSNILRFLDSEWCGVLNELQRKHIAKEIEFQWELAKLQRKSEPTESPSMRAAEQSAISRADYLLSHLAQECCEVAIRCTKAQHFGLGEIQPEQSLTNRQRIAEELADIYAIVEVLQRNGLLPAPLFSERDLAARISAKDRKAKHFRDYSRQLGRLED